CQSCEALRRPSARPPRLPVERPRILEGGPGRIGIGCGPQGPRLPAAPSGVPRMGARTRRRRPSPLRGSRRAPPRVGIDPGGRTVSDIEFVMMPLSVIEENPDNPRADLGDLSELADSIRAVGILQPVTV